MSSNSNGKPVSESHTTLSQLMQPEHANLLGNVHGGWIMKLVDEAGALACTRHARQRVVTVAVDQFLFKHPIRIGDLVILEAEVSYVGKTSMEAEINVHSENTITGERWHTNTAYLVYVALDETGIPVEVPRLIAETEEHETRMKEAELRQANRLSKRK